VPPPSRHIPALDGVRGLAVIGVLAYHAGYLQGGFLGVDLFFVLSGFLITSLLLTEHAGRGTISLGAFWARRARRLLPALFLVLAAVAVYAARLAAPLELDAIRRDGLATLAYVANWAQINAGVSYWDAFKAPSPLEHTWSLAIEEQFYVVWPGLVLLVLKVGRGSRRLLVAVALVLTAASLVALQLLHHPGADPSRVYFGSDTRAAALLYGALAAMAYAGRRRFRAGAVLPPVALASVVGVGLAWVTATGSSGWLYRWGLPATGIASAITIYALAIGAGGRALTAVLAWRPLRHIGAISYGLYLWHWPVDVVLTADRAHVSGLALTGLQTAVTVVIAELSYHLLEMPIRRGALRGWTARAVTPAALGALAAAVLIATAASVPTAPVGAGATPLPPPQATPAIDGALRVMVVGDSGAAFLGPGLAAVQGELTGPAGFPVQVGAFGEVGCGLPRTGDGVRDGSGRLLPDPDGCHDWPSRWAAELASFRPQVALLTLAWPGIGDRIVDGEARHPCDSVFDAYYQREVVAAIDTLHANGARVVVATTPYAALPGVDNARVDCLNATYRAAVAQRPGAEVLDLASWLCDGTACRTDSDGVDLRPDGVHFEGDGAVVAGRFALGEVLRLLGEPPADSSLPRLLLVGDSTAWRFGEGFAGVTAAPFVLEQSTVLGCGIVPGDIVHGSASIDGRPCDDVLDRWRAAAGSTQPAAVMLMSGAWEVLDHREGGDDVRFGSSSWDELADRSLDHFVASVGRGRPVVLATAPCYHQQASTVPGVTDRNDPARVAAWNRAVVAAAGRHPNVSVADVGGIVCPGGDDAGSIGGVTLRDDGVHLTAPGAALVWQQVMPALQTALARATNAR
jgi:peptidoglycan/LPS O-acetylase OafA/YrhL/lysophospholipase L1-like esterase